MPIKKIRLTREISKTDAGKNVITTRYNPYTKTGVMKEKDITYKSKEGPRVKFVEKQVVKRDKDLNWKSSSETKKLIKGGKKIKSESTFSTYKKGGAVKDDKWIQKAVNPAHKGYCTPMSKPTCTPKRKALARTFKAIAKAK